MSESARQAGSLAFRSVGTPGRSYLESRLRKAPSFGRLIVPNLNPQIFAVSALLPRDLDLAEQLNFNHGGVVDSTASRSLLVTLLTDYTSHDGQVLLAGNLLAQPTDPVMKESKTLWMWHGEEVYQIAPQGSSAAEIDSVLQEAETASGVVFGVCEWPERVQMEQGTQLTSETLLSMIATVGLIGVDAFDGESYVVAEKEP